MNVIYRWDTLIAFEPLKITIIMGEYQGEIIIKPICNFSLVFNNNIVLSDLFSTFFSGVAGISPKTYKEQIFKKGISIIEEELSVFFFL